MPTCSFCKKNYAEHKGLTVFTFDGRSVHYCSSKCRRNVGLGRDAKKVNWVKSEKKVGDDRKGKKVVVEGKENVVEVKERVKEEKVPVKVEEKKEKEVKKEEVVDEDEDEDDE